ncbi:hypothetical protein CIRG_02260 [Coccidioides immitis RMSCC 2394]|uniref:Uncharacterized protein n=1 Tax=Coccidioides immitis RMSCC 2394 TaxID=404692 RepID=A0A0J6Y0H3_COCIT|nr:hypothetical protein CIRG_02260 [Coccidioides immitis RMSCC 2394]
MLNLLLEVQKNNSSVQHGEDVCLALTKIQIALNKTRYPDYLIFCEDLPCENTCNSQQLAS